MQQMILLLIARFNQLDLPFSALKEFSENLSAFEVLSMRSRG